MFFACSEQRKTWREVSILSQGALVASAFTERDKATKAEKISFLTLKNSQLPRAEPNVLVGDDGHVFLGLEFGVADATPVVGETRMTSSGAGIIAPRYQVGEGEVLWLQVERRVFREAGKREEACAGAQR